EGIHELRGERLRGRALLLRSFGLRAPLRLRKREPRRRRRAQPLLATPLHAARTGVLPQPPARRVSLLEEPLRRERRGARLPEIRRESRREPALPAVVGAELARLQPSRLVALRGGVLLLHIPLSPGAGVAHGTRPGLLPPSARLFRLAGDPA